ncbi:MAG: hypothetical protein BGP05_21695 [Rhizobiales bacterium 62-47]|nr:MAG: hypothetical protein BGP05_21695 [Rhizobiales bacterium 62-47]
MVFVQQAVNTIARGTSDDSGVTVATTLVCFSLAHGAMGASGTRRSARPLFQEGEDVPHNSDAMPREIANPYSTPLFDIEIHRVARPAA